jgi:hypothetical protein
MRLFRIIPLLVILGFICCNKETDVTIINRHEYNIIAGDHDTIENNFYDYNPDFSLTGDFSLGFRELEASLDIDFDDKYDINFTNYCGSVYMDDGYGINTLYTHIETKAEVIYLGSLRIAGPFNEGDTIDKSSNWKTILKLADCTNPGGSNTYGWLTFNGFYSYMGLCYFKANDTIYGWLRLDPWITAYDAAINKIK